ncbi:hypothetical protein NitYY0826_C1363 [Nitratiruptor sp. YY08-26]|uniref:hypothetical protein n=1 Tax=unclassified Nitratiruptor TaxID=2624044 RepID=UPI001916566A|nr:MULTISPECIES: hypothetical protein [unclassified Nitratiruptor]BCD62487.1 hypothetical protein NitYY0813_C1361 [Nitratiruptor sp. YY08-13]BCD66423.1 hypothetical protein NitYY0826_C1363 [Nitratiruptor sp. YY08-26]
MRAEYKEECKYADEIAEDTKAVLEKWLKRYGWDIPELDEDVAAKLILTQMRKTLDELEVQYCGGACDTEPPTCPN